MKKLIILLLVLLLIGTNFIYLASGYTATVDEDARLFHDNKNEPADDKDVVAWVTQGEVVHLKFCKVYKDKGSFYIQKMDGGGEGFMWDSRLFAQKNKRLPTRSELRHAIKHPLDGWNCYAIFG